MTELDDKYGRCIAPAYVGAHERTRQRTWFIVDENSAERLRQYLEHGRGDAYLCRFFWGDYNTLWLIDDTGVIRLALEEIALDDSIPPITVPMPRTFDARNGKLGHPSLVEGRAARIGGELSLDPGDGTYYLSNKSGRYGLMRTKQELENAAARFRALGIDVQVHYLDARL